MGLGSLINTVGETVDGAINSATQLIFGRREPGQIGSLTLDTTIDERHEYTNQVSSFPIEDGSEITDHVRQEPERITLTGIVTKSPVKFLGGALVRKTDFFQRGNENDAVQEALETLLTDAGYAFPIQPGTLQARKNTVRPIDVVTGLRCYPGMIITNLSIPRDKSTGDAMRFSITLKKVNFVESPFEINTFTEANLSTANRVDKQESSTKGTGKNTVQTTTPSNRSSILLKGIRKIFR